MHCFLSDYLKKYAKSFELGMIKEVMIVYPHIKEYVEVKNRVFGGLQKKDYILYFPMNTKPADLFLNFIIKFEGELKEYQILYFQKVFGDFVDSLPEDYINSYIVDKYKDYDKIGEKDITYFVIFDDVTGFYVTVKARKVSNVARVKQVKRAKKYKKPMDLIDYGF